MPSPTPNERESYWKARAEQLPFWRLADRREARSYVSVTVRKRLIGRVALGACAVVLGWGAVHTDDAPCPLLSDKTPPAVELQLTNGPVHMTPATELQLATPPPR